MKLQLGATPKGNGFQALITYPDGVSVSSAEAFPSAGNAILMTAGKLLAMPERLEKANDPTLFPAKSVPICQCRASRSCAQSDAPKAQGSAAAPSMNRPPRLTRLKSLSKGAGDWRNEPGGAESVSEEIERSQLPTSGQCRYRPGIGYLDFRRREQQRQDLGGSRVAAVHWQEQVFGPRFQCSSMATIHCVRCRGSRRRPFR